jgi:2-iminobutanoate/2-iminopropanoate deaminase
MKQIIASEQAPAAIGPYSQAVKAGNTLYISGQLPIDPKTGNFSGDTISEQAKQSLENIGAILKEAGFGFEDVVKTIVYLKNISDFAAMNEVYGQYFKQDCPARAAFAVADLPRAALVEIEAVAYKG